MKVVTTFEDEEERWRVAPRPEVDRARDEAERERDLFNG